MCAAADLQRVVTADSGVLLAVVGDHHRVVHEVRLRRVEDGAHGVEQQIVGSDQRVDLQRDVGHDLTQRPLDAQDRAQDPAVGRTDVGVHERVGQHPVEGDPEPAQRTVEIVVAHAADEGRQHLVEITEVDRVGGDRRDVRVHDLQERQRVVEIGGRVELEMLRADGQRQLVVGQHVARRVRRVALVHVADHPLVERLLTRRRDRRVVDRFGRQRGQPAQLLVVAERVVTYECRGPSLISIISIGPPPVDARRSIRLDRTPAGERGNRVEGPSHGEDLRLVGECLELESVPRRVVEEHRPLLAGLAGEANVRLDHELRAGGCGVDRRGRGTRRWRGSTRSAAPVRRGRRPGCGSGRSRDGARWVTTWWPRRSQSTHVGALRPCGQPSV